MSRGAYEARYEKNARTLQVRAEGAGVRGEGR